MVAGLRVGLDDPGALSTVNDFGIARSAGLRVCGAGLRQGMLQSQSLQPQGNDLLLPWCKTHFTSLLCVPGQPVWFFPQVPLQEAGKTQLISYPRLFCLSWAATRATHRDL